jgi:hypothetical protein
MFEKFKVKAGGHQESLIKKKEIDTSDDAES